MQCLVLLSNACRIIEPQGIWLTLLSVNRPITALRKRLEESDMGTESQFFPEFNAIFTTRLNQQYENSDY